MAVVYYFGDVPVERAEVQEKMLIGDLRRFNEEARKKDTSITFREGAVHSREMFGGKEKHAPIGINKPLYVEILCAYSGDAPQKFLGGKKDVMIVSGIKDYHTYSAAPKAINLIKSKVEDHKMIRFHAFDEGCPVVYYSRAVDVGTIQLSFNLVADTFSDDIFQKISYLFSMAAGLPIFAPAAPFLIAGGNVSGLVGNLGKVLFESRPFLNDGEELRFDTVGYSINKGGYRLVCNEDDLKELKQYKPGNLDDGSGDPKPILVHREHGVAYEGDAPYMLLNVDGKERPELESFTPKIATAAILERYYGAMDRGNQSVSILETAMKLYNDYDYHQKALNLEKEMKGMRKNTKDYKRAKELFTAYKRNIRSEQFQLKKK